MTSSRRTHKGESQDRFTRPQTDGVRRLARIAARALLWGCVLLLLVRGALSMLNTESRVPTTTSGVTVTATQPATTETAKAQRK